VLGQRCKKRLQPDRRRQHRDCGPGETSALACSARDGACRNSWFLLTDRAKTTSVIDTITRRAKHEAGLPVLILKIPNNPILQSCALPDYNCGATLVLTRMCVHVFSSSNSHFCGADEDAPV
jgi:hypothetical protein